jgi:succinate dehydrogenase / fumarate reductase membrane anchor subunit
MGISQKGLHDWIIQRISAVVLAGYIIFLAGFFMLHSSVDFMMWQKLFSNRVMQIATMLTLLALMWHAWIGIWAVFTDYIKCSVLRGTLEVIVLIALFSFFFWGITILWSI